MIKKLKSRAGLTLTELLVTMLILTLFSSACVLGITTALRARKDHIKLNDADILASLVQNTITDELRLCENPEETDGGLSVTFKSSVYESVTLYIGDYEVEDGDGNKVPYPGRLYMKVNSTSDTDPMMLLSNASYSHNTLKITDPVFKINGAVIEVSFEIKDINDMPLASRSFSVRPLNDIS